MKTLTIVITVGIIWTQTVASEYTKGEWNCMSNFKENEKCSSEQNCVLKMHYVKFSL